MHAWNEAKQTGWLSTESIAAEGFIHCSYDTQVLTPANERYSGRDDLHLLVIDPNLVTAKIVVEDSYGSGNEFPHIYGPLNTDAVRTIVPFPRGKSGSFENVPDIYSTTPPPAQPDDKDWTWVLDRPCPDCGADVGALSLVEIAHFNRKSAARWAKLMQEPEDWVRTRPEPQVWSPLEYACHVRDVYRLFGERLDLILDQDNPTFANWNPNTTATQQRYDLADPATVAVEVVAAAEELAAEFELVTPDQLQRKGLRSDGAAFTLQTFARYELHDPEHHLWDVTGEQSLAGA